MVELDEREETGLRAKLNYGHTFAHAYETVAGYGTWLHGEAVSAGMLAASRLAERLGRIPARLGGSLLQRGFQMIRAVMSLQSQRHLRWRFGNLFSGKPH